MARTPFKLRSGNTTPFKKMGSSPARDAGHGVKEEHGHFESGRVDPRTLSNRFSEFNIKQEEKGHPTKIVSIDPDTGKKRWNWSNKPDQFRPLGASTQGERDADIEKHQDETKVGGKGTYVKELQITRDALTREALIETEKKSKKQLMEESGKSTNILNRLLTSKKKLKTKARAQDYRHYQKDLVHQAVSRKAAEKLEPGADVTPE